MAVEITNRTITRKELHRHGLKDNYFIEKWYGNTGWEFIPGERDNMIKHTKIYRFSDINLTEEDSRVAWKALEDPCYCMFCMNEKPVIWLMPKLDKAEIAIEAVVGNIDKFDWKPFCRNRVKLVSGLKLLNSGSRTSEFTMDWYNTYSDVIDFLLATRFSGLGSVVGLGSEELQFCMSLLENGNLKLWLYKSF